MDTNRGTGIAISGMGIGGEIAEALHLPHGTNLIQIRIGLDEAVEVICRFYPDADAMEQCTAILQRFHLMPAPAETPATLPPLADARLDAPCDRAAPTDDVPFEIRTRYLYAQYLVAQAKPDLVGVTTPSIQSRLTGERLITIIQGEGWWTYAWPQDSWRLQADIAREVWGPATAEVRAYRDRTQELHRA